MDAKAALNSLSTLQDYIRWGASQFNKNECFFGHGSSNAIDEAAYLVLHSLHLPPDLPSQYLQSQLTEPEAKAIITLFQRRISERQPAAYLTHEAWFCGLSFYVNESVLVPRSPFAELIENGFQPWVERSVDSPVDSLLEIGTGSGCIAIACAYAFDEAQIVATDIDPAALVVAQRNVTEHDLQDRVTLCEANVFEGLPSTHYDLIISNPPYVSEAEMAILPAEYHQEPEHALVAGPQGLDIVLPMLRDAADWLSDHGRLFVEVGFSQPVFEQVLEGLPITWVEFERGGSGVFTISAAELQTHQALIEQIYQKMSKV